MCVCAYKFFGLVSLICFHWLNFVLVGGLRSELEVADLALSLWIGAGERMEQPIAQTLVALLPLAFLAVSLIMATRNGDAMPLTLRHARRKATLVRVPHGRHAVIAALRPPRDARVLGGARRGGIVATVVCLRAGIEWQQRQPGLRRQRQYIRNLIQLVLRILQRAASFLLLQLADVVVLRREALLALRQAGIGGAVRLAQQRIVVHARYLHDAVQAGQRALARAVRRLLGWTWRQTVGGLAANAALANIEAERGLTEHAAHLRAVERRRGRHLGHGQLRGEDLMQAGQLIELMSAREESEQGRIG